MISRQPKVSIRSHGVQHGQLQNLLWISAQVPSVADKVVWMTSHTWEVGTEDARLQVLFHKCDLSACAHETSDKSGKRCKKCDSMRSACVLSRAQCSNCCRLSFAGTAYGRRNPTIIWNTAANVRHRQRTRICVFEKWKLKTYLRV